MTNAITPPNWFDILLIRSQNETDSNLPSRLGIAFLLDSGASISLLTQSICTIFTQMFHVCNQAEQDPSKTLENF